MRADGFAIDLQGERGRLLVGAEDFRGRLGRFLLTESKVPNGSLIDLRFHNRVGITREA
jgi:hypothetical protein